MPRLALLVLVALAACSSPQTAADPPVVDDAPTAPPGTATEPLTEDLGSGIACTAVETIPIQGGEHLIGNQEPPVPYSSTPPTSGWHVSGAFDIEIFDEPLSEPKQVSVLEAGGVVVSHHGLDDAERLALEELVRTEFDGRAAVTPYPELEAGQVALTAWGTLQFCDGVDLEAIAGFITEHADEQPHRPGGH